MGMRDASDMFSHFQPGETVLIEFPSEFPSELLLLNLVTWASGKGTPIVVDDILDTFPQYLSRLAVRNADLAFLSSVPVIKIGGDWKAGNVVGGVDVDKHSIDTRYYDCIYYANRSSDFVLNPIVGFHKFFPCLPVRELFHLIRNISTFVNRKDRVAVYLTNRDVISPEKSSPYHIFREVVTTLVSVQFSDGHYVGKVLKAVNPNLPGVKFMLP